MIGETEKLLQGHPDGENDSLVKEEERKKSKEVDHQSLQKSAVGQQTFAVCGADENDENDF